MAEEKKDFVVKDRRLFSEDRDESEVEKESAAREEAPKPSGTRKEAPAGDAAGEPEEDLRLPEINFPTFIFSINSSALVHLGVIEDPASGQKSKNLPMAKQTIDMLGMIEEKTRGNLTDDEASMLKHILYELRMIYVKERG